MPATSEKLSEGNLRLFAYMIISITVIFYYYSLCASIAYLFLWFY